MEFTGPDGKSVVLRGMHSYPPQTVSAHRMEADLQHGHIAWAVELQQDLGGESPTLGGGAAYFGGTAVLCQVVHV